MTRGSPLSCFSGVTWSSLVFSAQVFSTKNQFVKHARGALANPYLRYAFPFVFPPMVIGSRCSPAALRHFATLGLAPAAANQQFVGVDRHVRAHLEYRHILYMPHMKPPFSTS